jgi:SAM-dependent methyltransferase
VGPGAVTGRGSGSGFTDHFSDRAADYATHRPSYPAALADFLAGTVTRRGLAWDAGAGSGQLSVLLADRFERVVATDASAAQLAHAAPHPRVEYRCAPAEASGLPAGSADLAVAAQAAHWFDIAGYYAEVRRVGRPGAVIALVCYELMHVDTALDPVIRDFYARVLGSYWPPERRHTETGYRSLPFPFAELDAPRLEMRAEWTLVDALGYVDTWSAVRALERAQGRAALNEFRRDFARAWGPNETVRVIRWPLALRVGRL